MDTFEFRTARLDDLDVLDAVMDGAIGELQRGFLSPEQIAASRAVMGLDRQLVIDGTYFIAQLDGAIAGCGGWSRRATLYGGDHSVPINSHAVNPAARAAASQCASIARPTPRRANAGAVYIARIRAGSVAGSSRRGSRKATL